MEEGVLEEWENYDSQFSYELTRGEDGIAELNGSLIENIFERIDPEDPDSMRHFAKLLEWITELCRLCAILGSKMVRKCV